VKRSRGLSPVDRDVICARFDLLVACENCKGRTWAARLREIRRVLLSLGYVLEARHVRSLTVNPTEILDE
jgi:hypothetical protein